VSTRMQKFLLQLSIVLLVSFFAILAFLIHMFPPVDPNWSADEIAAFYQKYSTQIRFGVMLSSWITGGFLAWIVVIAAQIYRVEKLKPGKAPVLSWLTLLGGALQAMVLALPMMWWGVAAYTPSRAPDATAVIHEMAMLNWITADQWLPWVYLPIVIVCLIPRTVTHSPFPRWLGYCTILMAVTSETGALAYMSRSSLLGWNGLLPWWIPIFSFGIWYVIFNTQVFKALNAQIAEEQLAEQETAQAA